MGDSDAWRGVEGPGGLSFLGHLADVDLFDVVCRMRNVGFFGTQPVGVYTVILVSGGGFLHRVHREESFVDTMSAVVVRPGDQLTVAHPAGFDDRSTVLQYAEEPYLDLAPGARQVSDDLFLRHRALVAACRRGLDPVELAERIDLLVHALAAPERSARRDGRTMRFGTRQVHRRMVDRTVEALGDGGYRRGLDELATIAGASRHHLSRVFQAVTGMTVTAYRNRLRVRAVLADIQQGAPNLRELAHAYGFADQAHLIRVVRGQFGRTPGEIRRLLNAGTAGDTAADACE
ncbi:AraC family transcriptional regulator [Hamadaea sp. NPDC051192]|uniref:helix-turn-helix domain-containing protein n=1 Tax=Hamadaea sp. NPDC051192 TaxID=3154940 RepID=UPI00343C97AE